MKSDIRRIERAVKKLDPFKPRMIVQFYSEATRETLPGQEEARPGDTVIRFSEVLRGI